MTTVSTDLLKFKESIVRTTVEGSRNGIEVGTVGGWARWAYGPHRPGPEATRRVEPGYTRSNVYR